MVGPQLGRETDAIAESAYMIEHRLCVMTHACDIIIRSAGKVAGQSRTRRTGGGTSEMYHKLDTQPEVLYNTAN